MQFTKTLTTALTLFVLALPAIAANPPAAPAPAAAAKPAAPAQLSEKITQDQAKVVAGQLKEYFTAIDAELTQCTSAKNLSHCLARAVDVSGKTTLTPAETKTLTEQYTTKLGKELGDCTKKHGFAACKTRIQGADDNKKINLDKRGGFSDFMGGFVKGFTGVFKVAGPIIGAFL